jgi:phosphatidylglycerophosphatase C
MIPTLAVFDFDGTITRGDTLVPLLARVNLSRTLRHAPPAVVRASRDRHARDRAKEQLLQAVLAGADEEHVHRLSRAFVQTRLDRIARPHVIRRLRRHQADGHHLVLASASPQFVVEPAARHLGFDSVLCTRVERDADGRWGLRGPNLRGDAKRHALEQVAVQLEPQQIWAYGDSSDDLPMLRWADHGFRVRARDVLPVPSERVRVDAEPRAAALVATGGDR